MIAPSPAPFSSPCLRVLYLRIAPSRFFWLKNILEGYDNLAVLSRDTVTAHGTLLRYPAEREREVFSLLTSISATLIS
ncbi:MAG TPA: hypothetical protein DEQ02_07045 [Ruminococcaceae bacterium]|nr:hypothetical protein [Oscillospiraceae bacterium]